MRLGIEIAQFFREFQTGLYNYGVNLVRGMARLAGRHRITLFTDDTSSPARLKEVVELCSPLPIRLFRNPGRPYRLRLALDPISRQDAFFYVTDQVGPPLENRVNACLIPDLTPLHDHCWHTDVNRRRWLDHFDWVHKHADVVITFSEHTRSDVSQRLGIPADKIHAIPLAAAEHFRPLDDCQVASRLQPFGLRPGEYILSVGTLEPRKNHLRLLRAYHRLIARGLAAEQELVLAGPKGWDYEDIFHEIDRLGLRSRVRYLGQVAHLELLMNGATVLAYPSLYEGFGLPPLEAMACGTPVIASNSTSLPEVVGDAGLLVNPEDEQALAEALAQVVSDPALRLRMSAAGLRRSQLFSWDLTTESTLQVIESAVPRAKRRGYQMAGAH